MKIKKGKIIIMSRKMIVLRIQLFSFIFQSLLLLILLLFLLSLTPLLLITVQGFPHGSSFDSSLYTYQDPVNILYTDNITRFIVNNHRDGRKIQLVQFFNTYCGHCQAFAPLFKEFLKSTRKWTGLVDFSVLDCSHASNSEACRRYNIMLYPTLRTFWFQPSESDLGQDFPLIHWNSAQDLRNSFIKWITDQWKQGNIPKHWPNFIPLIADSEQNLIHQLKLDQDERQILIVVEKINSFFGRELMMNFSRHFDEIKMFRMEESSIKVLDQIFPDVLDKFKIPFLFAISNQDRKFKIIPKPIMSDEEDYVYFTNVIQKDFLKNSHDHEDEDNHLNKNNIGANPAAVEAANYSTRVYMSDLHNAIRFALFHEVPLKKHLNLDQVNALIRFLNVLYESFYFQNDKTKQFIKHFHDWLVKHLNLNSKRSRSKHDYIIDTNDMLTTMNMYEEYYHFPEKKPWCSCADVSSNHQRSYPCSLWTLFHVLTVAEYRRSLQTKQWVSLHPALYAMREYIRHFFGCTECSQHFGQMSATLENELTYPNSSVMWLWRAHNKVNARLKGSRSEDRRLPKRQFPTYQECSYCYRRKPPKQMDYEQVYKHFSTYLEYYDQEKVLQFLVNFYAAEHIALDDSKSESSNHGDHQIKTVNLDHPILIDDMKQVSDLNHVSKSRNKILMFVSIQFTQTDISLIFVFYIVSILLLVSICSYVRLRRNIFHKVFILKQRIY